MPNKSSEQSFSMMVSCLTGLRNGIAQTVAAERRIERQLDLNKDMAQTWLNRAEEKTQRGEDKLARVAIDQHKHHCAVVQNFERELQQSRDRSLICTRLINQFDQISDRFRVMQLLMSSVSALEQREASNYQTLAEDVGAFFTEKYELGEAQDTEALSEFESRMEALEANILREYEHVPPSELKTIVDRVIEEKRQIEEDRRRNQQMVDTWESRVQIAAEMGEEELILPAAARKKTYQLRITNIDKSLKLLTAISGLLKDRD